MKAAQLVFLIAFVLGLGGGIGYLMGSIKQDSEVAAPDVQHPQHHRSTKDSSKKSLHNETPPNFQRALSQSGILQHSGTAVDYGTIHGVEVTLGIAALHTWLIHGVLWSHERQGTCRQSELDLSFALVWRSLHGMPFDQEPTLRPGKMLDREISNRMMAWCILLKSGTPIQVIARALGLKAADLPSLRKALNLNSRAGEKEILAALEKRRRIVGGKRIASRIKRFYTRDSLPWTECRQSAGRLTRIEQLRQKYPIW